MDDIDEVTRPTQIMVRLNITVWRNQKNILT